MSVAPAQPHGLPPERLAAELDSHLEHGLAPDEARRRLAKSGPNELVERPRPGFLALLLDQLRNFLVVVLVAAALASLALGEVVDAAAILVIVALNTILGVVQESRAEQALTALKRMAAPTAQVLRGGRQTTLAARELVPGDLVLLEAGNYVPADVRLVESVNLRVDEAALTGESVPVSKNARVVLDGEVPLGDRKNSAFMGTLVTYGRGRGLVTATGMRTQFGLIAEMLQSFEEEATPLQRRLDQLGRWLGLGSLGLCALIFVIGVARDTAPLTILSRGLSTYLAEHQLALVELFMTGVSLAIAAVPEGLPAVVTICLALGMQRMVRRHALIRKLPAVETLGCATVICSDKTGTLTQNEMTVVRGWVAGRTFEVTGEGYDPSGQIVQAGQPLDVLAPGADPAASLLLHGALLCSDARLEPSGEDAGQRTWRMIGDPTEGALVVAAAKAGLWRQDAERHLPRVLEVPFDSERKRMATVHRLAADAELPWATAFGAPRTPAAVAPDTNIAADTPVAFVAFVAFVKGAPDVVLELCERVLVGGATRPLDAPTRHEVLAAVQDMGREALRVIGVACRPLASLPASPDRAGPPAPEVEQGLTFVGLLGMIDPARPEVEAAVAVARGAGLKTVMVTGDYRDTALAIAERIGLLTPGGRVLTGAQLDQLSDVELAAVAERVDVFARVSPQHKVKIVEALHARGHVVAMTGDGVNDAPALKRASIGVAMGIAGTDVSKATADVVLTDDNYASIVAAIEEGRTIYANIRKFVFYLVSCNVSEILIIFVSMLAGLPIPLRPTMLLWLNLVTDGAPALALGLERGDPDVMRRPPRPTDEPVIDREMLLGTAVQGVVKTAAVLAAFVYGLQRFPDSLAAAQTVAFATLAISELLRAYTSRSERHLVFSIGLFSNRWLAGATALSAVLLLLVIYVPFLQPAFDTVALSLLDWLVLVPFILAAPVAAELTKVALNRWAPLAPAERARPRAVSR